MKKHEHIVKSLMPGGIGEELGIEPGDKLLAINGNEIQDVFDYYYYEESEQLLLLIEKPGRGGRMGSWRLRRMRMKVWGSSLTRV